MLGGTEHTPENPQSVVLLFRGATITSPVNATQLPTSFLSSGLGR